ncbi:DUF6891 domain-containing protein [Dactylosporangium sp. CS-047395]|uniref:DUF6891 domain-containing protein n=1 Tax=Dactylosporangium sp. CS-047395 TaxID=3239936 RepID=UPI003D9198B7
MTARQRLVRAARDGFGRAAPVTLSRVNGDELEAAAGTYVRTAVACGRLTCTQVVEGVVDHLHGYAGPGELRALGWRLAGPEFAAHLVAQAGWSDRTDSERLTDAFRALDAAGIVAREDFACCQNCGTGEIGGEVLPDFPARGYAFYHLQDADRAAGGGELWIAWGRFDAPPDAELGDEIAAALRGQGLAVDWDGDPGMRIRVPMTWARRRVGQMAAYVVPDPDEREVVFEPPGGRMAVPMPVSAVAAVELPWLPAGRAARVDGVEVTRRQHLLVLSDGRRAGRFDGLRLLGGAESQPAPGDESVPEDESGPSRESKPSGKSGPGGESAPGGGEPLPGGGEPVPGGGGPVPAGEAGLIEVTYEIGPGGPIEADGVPMPWEAAAEMVRRMPTRTGSWLSAISPSGRIVQLALDDGRLWLESPQPDDESSTGKHATVEEAELMLRILAEEDRVAIAELPGAVRRPW